MSRAALEVFSEHGYPAASIEEIAARAGVTKGAVYYYFRDKHDLAMDLHRELWSAIAVKAQHGLDPAEGTAANLKRALRQCLQALREHEHARVFLREFWQVPALDVAGRRQQDAGALQVQPLVERGMATGELVPVDAATFTRALLGAFAEATLHVLSGGRADDAVEVIERMVDGFRRAPTRPDMQEALR